MPAYICIIHTIDRDIYMCMNITKNVRVCVHIYVYMYTYALSETIVAKDEGRLARFCKVIKKELV